MTVHEEWLNGLKAFPGNLKLPPPSLLELQLEYIEMIPGQKLVAKLPFQKRFTNPVGVFQGGFLAAGIDDVLGPLSYMTSSGPCLTLSLNITYLKPFTENMGQCLIQGEVLKVTKNFIFMRAEVRSLEGELIAHGESHVNRIGP
jgi:uncharacterized protein (TIGR00369 family)